MQNFEKKIHFLIRLLDDRDDKIRAKINDELVAMGEDAEPFLEIAVRSENLRLRSEAIRALRSLAPQKIEKKLRGLISKNGQELNLEEGILIVMGFAYPEASASAIRTTLDKLAEEFRATLPEEDVSPSDQVQLLVKFLFVQKEFTGNFNDYSHPDNSYFNKVLETKVGIPITLSILCMLVAKRLSLPVAGVGLPGHYIIQYDSLSEPLYFDPFNKGSILSADECCEIARKSGYTFEKHHLLRATNQETLVRVLNNLVYSYVRAKEESKAHQMKKFAKAVMGTSENKRPSNKI